jgi:transcriptional regulator with XRE-family HTH domain
VSRVEAEKINGTLFVLQALASALDISLAEILSEIENEKCPDAISNPIFPQFTGR